LRPRLQIAIESYPWVAPLVHEQVRLPNIDLEFIKVEPITAAFRRMCRTLEFDVCEMAVSTYLVARRYNVPMMALPVFVNRMVPGNVVYDGRRNALDANPKALEGGRIGVRAYTVTGGVWLRAMLVEAFGVDFSGVTWVLADEEHVREFTPTRPIELDYRVGANLSELLAAGQIVAILDVGQPRRGGPVPMFGDMRAREIEWARRTNIYPINHTVVIRNSTAAQLGHLVQELYEGFVEAHAIWRNQAAKAPASQLTEVERELIGRSTWLGADVLPYGFAVNKPTLEALHRTLIEQGMLPAVRPLGQAIGDVFMLSNT
jgi:4,5-dihydroxyphthalate decarboxylase